MARKLENKVIVVTGSGRGIGRAVARKMAAEGARIVVADYGGEWDGVSQRSHTPADQVVAEIGEAGGDAVACYEDMSTLAGAQKAISIAQDRFGRLDGMALYAGISMGGPIWELSEDAWDSVMRVHLRQHFVCTKAVAPLMMKQRGGRLLFVSSGAAINGPPDGSNYAAAKAGILGFTWSASKALKAYGVTVNCVMPGGYTRLVQNIKGDWGSRSTEPIPKMTEDQVNGSIYDPANNAAAAIYLMSDAGAGITGQTFGTFGFQISLYDLPRPIASLQTDGPWDIDDVFKRFPAKFGKERSLETKVWKTGTNVEAPR